MTKSFDFTPVLVCSAQCLKHFTKKERREYLHMQYTVAAHLRADELRAALYLVNSLV